MSKNKTIKSASELCKESLANVRGGKSARIKRYPYIPQNLLTWTIDGKKEANHLYLKNLQLCIRATQKGLLTNKLDNKSWETTWNWLNDIEKEINFLIKEMGLNSTGENNV